MHREEDSASASALEHWEASEPAVVAPSVPLEVCQTSPRVKVGQVSDSLPQTLLKSVLWIASI